MSELSSRDRDVSVLAKGTGIAFVGAVASALFSYAFVAVAARGLGARTYGTLTLALNIVNLFSLIALFGLNRGALRYVAIYRGTVDKARERGVVLFTTLIVLCSSVILAAVAYIAAPRLASLLAGGSNEFTTALRPLSFAIPLFALLTLYGSIANGQRKILYWVLSVNICQPLTSVLLLGAVLLLGWGLGGAVVAYLVSCVLGLAVALWLQRGYFLRSTAQVPPHYEMRPVVLFALPLAVVNVLDRTTTQLDTYMLGFLGTRADVGVFALAAKTVTVTLMVLSSINTMFAPMIADLYHRGQKGELTSLLMLVTRWSLTFSLPVCVAILLFAQPILHFFGHDFQTGSTALMILAVGQLVNAATGPVGYILSMTGHSGLSLFDSVVVIVLNVILDLLLIPRFGLLGAAVGSSMSSAGINLLRFAQVHHVLQVYPYNSRCLKPILANALAAVPAWLLRSYWLPGKGTWGLASSLAAFGLCFLAALLMLGLEDDDRNALQALLLRLNRMAKADSAA